MINYIDMLRIYAEASNDERNKEYWNLLCDLADTCHIKMGLSFGHRVNQEIEDIVEQIDRTSFINLEGRLEDRR